MEEATVVKVSQGILEVLLQTGPDRGKQKKIKAHAAAFVRKNDHDDSAPVVAVNDGDADPGEAKEEDEGEANLLAQILAE
jgi:hypothetical protein